jgi:O-antigen/teichoic acid export membrane protein
MPTESPHITEIELGCAQVGALSPGSGNGRGRGKHVQHQLIAHGVTAAIRRVSPNVRWTVIDQGISSASSLLLVATVARSSDVGEFGAFSLVFLAYGLLLGAARAVGGDILLLRAEQQRANLERDTRRLLGLALVIGSVGGIVGCLIAAGASGTLGGSLLAVGAVLPILMLQDALRYCLFAHRAPAQAAVNDLVWLAVQMIATVALLLAVPGAGAAAIILAWAAGAAAAVGTGLRRARLTPTLRDVSAWFTQDRVRVSSFFGDFAVWSASAYASFYLIALIGGVDAVAALRGAALLFSPLDALFLSLRVVTLPALARSAALGGASLRQQARLVAGLTGALTLTWAAAVLSLPDRLGQAMLGASWEVVTPILVPVALASTARFLAIPSHSGLRALGDTGRIVRLRTIMTFLVLASVVVGTFEGGARGAAIGLAGAYATEAILSWGGFLVSSRRFLASRSRRASEGSVAE